MPWNQRSSGLSLSPVLWVGRSSPLDADRRLQEDGRFPGAHLVVGAAFQRRGRRRVLSSITSSTSPCPCPWEMWKAALKRMSESIGVVLVVMRTTS